MQQPFTDVIHSQGKKNIKAVTMDTCKTAKKTVIGVIHSENEAPSTVTE